MRSSLDSNGDSAAAVYRSAHSRCPACAGQLDSIDGPAWREPFSTAGWLLSVAEAIEIVFEITARRAA